MSGSNFYEILGVGENSDENEIKKAYRNLSLKYHPDRNKTEEALEKYKLINEAYETLGDEELRKKYNHQLKHGDNPFGFPGNEDMSDEESNEESEEESVNNCDECNIELDRYRDGSTDKNIRCNNCYWEDKEGKYSSNLIKPDYREKDEERYVTCNNCDERIDCWNCNIYCLYKGEQKSPSEEITICQFCNDDLKEEFEEEGYKCDDWDEDESTPENNDSTVFDSIIANKES